MKVRLAYNIICLRREGVVVFHQIGILIRLTRIAPPMLMLYPKAGALDRQDTSEFGNDPQLCSRLANALVVSHLDR